MNIPGLHIVKQCHVCAGVYAALLHGYSLRSSSLNRSSTVNVGGTVSRVRLDSAWFPPPVAGGRSSCRVQFALSSDVPLTSSSSSSLELRLHSNASQTTVWSLHSSPADWNPTPRSALFCRPLSAVAPSAM